MGSCGAAPLGMHEPWSLVGHFWPMPLWLLQAVGVSQVKGLGELWQ